MLKNIIELVIILEYYYKKLKYESFHIINILLIYLQKNCKRCDVNEIINIKNKNKLQIIIILDMSMIFILN